jgi:cytochrome c
MNRRSAITLASALLCSGFGLSGVAVAQQTGTAAEAEAMLQKAVTELKANEAAALAKFNQDYAKCSGEFRDRDLYVFCFEVGTGKLTAGQPDLLNTDVRAAVKEGTITTITYNFPKPGGTDPVPKESHVTRVGNQGCGVGVYK